MKILNTIDNAITFASHKLNVISGIALVIMMVLVFTNVVLRAVWRPILGTYEVTAFLAAITISFALAHCAVNKGHIALTLFVDRLPSRVQAIIDTFTYTIGTVLFTVLAKEVAKYALHTRGTGEVGMTTEIPFYPFIFGVAFGLLMLAIVLFIDILKSIKRMIAG